jgi:hypothetical protein
LRGASRQKACRGAHSGVLGLLCCNVQAASGACLCQRGRALARRQVQLGTCLHTTPAPSETAGAMSLTWAEQGCLPVLQGGVLRATEHVPDKEVRMWRHHKTCFRR